MGTDAVNFNSQKLRQAFAAYCHATYGDKRVFDWLLRYGGLDEQAADAMTQETLRVRAACRAANSRPAAGAQPPAPRESGRDPNPNVAARIAASQRRAAARQDNYQLRLQGVLEEPGACEACGYYGSLTACYWCHRAVCSWHQVKGYLVCVDCDERHGRELRTPSHMPQDRRPPSHCDTLRCQRQDLHGQCITCHRYICQGCALDQPLTHCVVCGALSRGDGFVVLRLGCAALARALGDLLAGLSLSSWLHSPFGCLRPGACPLPRHLPQDPARDPRPRVLVRSPAQAVSGGAVGEGRPVDGAGWSRSAIVRRLCPRHSQQAGDGAPSRAGVASGPGWWQQRERWPCQRTRQLRLGLADSQAMTTGVASGAGWQ